MTTALFRLLIELCDIVARFESMTRRAPEDGSNLPAALLPSSEQLRAIAHRVRSEETTMDVPDLVSRVERIIADVRVWQASGDHREEKQRTQARLVIEQGELVISLLRKHAAAANSRVPRV